MPHCPGNSAAGPTHAVDPHPPTPSPIRRARWGTSTPSAKRSHREHHSAAAPPWASVGLLAGWEPEQLGVGRKARPAGGSSPRRASTRPARLAAHPGTAGYPGRWGPALLDRRPAGTAPWNAMPAGSLRLPPLIRREERRLGAAGFWEPWRTHSSVTLHTPNARDLDRATRRAGRSPPTPNLPPRGGLLEHGHDLAAAGHTDQRLE